MGYIIVFFTGILTGIIIAANIMINSDTRKREEAYYKGIEEGKRIASKNNNNQSMYKDDCN